MWLDRLNKIINNESMELLKNKTVLIIGLGGVGGHALESIVRMAINNIIIVDNDKVDITNLNRQLISLTSNIGELKVDVAKKRILDINPNCNVITINKFIDKDNILIIHMNDYGEAIHYGTRPHMPPVGAIQGWANRKGINAWALAKSINTYGTQAQSS